MQENAYETKLANFATANINRRKIIDVLEDSDRNTEEIKEIIGKSNFIPSQNFTRS